MTLITRHLDMEKTLAFLNEVQECTALSGLSAVVKRATMPLGVSSILAGFIPRYGALPKEQARHVMLADWPDDWREIYFRENLMLRDPTIRRVLWSKPAFLWTELYGEPDFGKDERFLMDRAKEFYLYDGCTIPLISLDGRHAGFSFAGVNIDDSPEARGLLNLIACFSFARALEIQNETARSSVRLTARERETIAWVAAGKTNWEISVILGISEKAVSKHVSNARLKFGAVNRAHLVAEAIRLKVIS
jgi:LuxR family quorum sensing-dependent transcriptional regulator